jgi:hypothetical protein
MAEQKTVIQHSGFWKKRHGVVYPGLVAHYHTTVLSTTGSHYHCPSNSRFFSLMHIRHVGYQTIGISHPPSLQVLI